MVAVQSRLRRGPPVTPPKRRQATLAPGPRPELTIRGHELLYVVAMVGMATVGAMLTGRRPRHPVGWLLLALGLSVTVDGVTDADARNGLLAGDGGPGSPPSRR